MEISSRTPEGLPNRCPVCGKIVRLEPSEPVGDAPCPHCGQLLIFVATEAGLWLFHKRGIEPPADRPAHPAGSIAVGEQVRVRSGTFENFEGVVDWIDEENRRIRVMINIFGHRTPVEMETWQAELI